MILSGKRAASVARREDGDGRVLPSHTSSSGGVARTRWQASWNNSIWKSVMSSIVGCAKEREVKVSLDGVYEVRAAGSVRTKVECGCDEDEGL